jgi:hypothetical protein
VRLDDEEFNDYDVLNAPKPPGTRSGAGTAWYFAAAAPGGFERPHFAGVSGWLRAFGATAAQLPFNRRANAWAQGCRWRARLSTWPLGQASFGCPRSAAGA